MKRIELTISKLLCTALLVTGTLLSTSCKKDGPVAPKDEKLEITASVEVDYTGATFSGTLELGADVSATAEAGIEYAANSDFNNATKVVAKSNDKGAYSVSIDGLLLGTTYYYRTYTLASKESSPVYGESSNFTTKDLTVTLSAGEISIEGVTISGTVDALPEGFSLSVAYALSEDASEWTELAVTPEQSENGYVFSTNITDIEENSTVWYKAVATYGDNKKDYAKASLTFKNEITLEYITVNDATYPEVKDKEGSVKFTGSVNIPESLKTAYSPKVVFKYSTDENFAEAVTVSTEITGSTIEIVKSDLAPSTTYYYKAELTVGSKTSSTAVKSFTSQNLQFSLTPLQARITETSADMYGSIIGYSGWDVKGLTFYTRYSTNEDCSNATDVEMKYDNSPMAFCPYMCSLSGLQPSTIYYYCLVIKKGEEVKSVGDIKSFTTKAAKPTIDNITVDDATYPEVKDKDGSVKFTGSVNISDESRAEYSPKVVFKYSTDENFAEAVTVSTEITGSTIEIVKSDLAPSTTYYYKAELTVGSKTSSTAVKSFTSQNLQFSLTPLQARITETSADMYGSIIGYSGWDVKGLTFYTRYSTNEDCSTDAIDVEMKYDDNPMAYLPYSCSLSDLQPSTKYYYRHVIKKGEEVKSEGDINSFTTGPVTVEFATSDLAKATGASTGSPKTISKENVSCEMNGVGLSTGFKFGTIESYVKITAPRNIQSVKLTCETGKTHTFRLKKAKANGDTSDNDVASHTLNGTETDVILTPDQFKKTLWLTSSGSGTIKIYSMTIVYK